MVTTIALVLAAGRGSRMQLDSPKQYADLCGKPVLRWSVETFLEHQHIDRVFVVYHPADRLLYENATAGLALPNPISGGSTRQESAKRGLEALAIHNPDRVLIHDGARPFVKTSLINDLLDSLFNTNAVVPGLPIVDTLKRVIDSEVEETITRDNLWRIQTPQIFNYSEVLEAHRTFIDQHFSDDSAMLETAGLKVKIVEGDVENIKITQANDLLAAREKLMGTTPLIQVGTGFDVHRFGKGDHVILCGVKIPFQFSLEGHSDGDVAIHSVVDAILGAISMGDIGQHFPSTEDKWKNCNSKLFLEQVMELLQTVGGKVIHLDLTIICNAPNISKFRNPMRTQMSEIMDIPVETISIKATTTDGLGFTGRGEGIAVQTVATIALTNF